MYNEEKYGHDKTYICYNAYLFVLVLGSVTYMTVYVI